MGGGNSKAKAPPPKPRDGEEFLEVVWVEDLK